MASSIVVLAETLMLAMASFVRVSSLSGRSAMPTTPSTVSLMSSPVYPPAFLFTQRPTAEPRVGGAGAGGVRDLAHGAHADGGEGEADGDQQQEQEERAGKLGHLRRAGRAAPVTRARAERGGGVRYPAHSDRVLLPWRPTAPERGLGSTEYARSG